MSKPVAVLVSDVHYNLSTLKIADRAVRMAVATANKLEVPLISCGDLHDSKAILRGECVKAIIETFKLCRIQPIALVGNHSRINERSPEHALEFLRSYARIVDTPERLISGWQGIPYDHDVDNLRRRLSRYTKGAKFIMHQGLLGTTAGEYYVDRSALSHDDVKGFRVISGHYHARQTVRLPEGGQWDFVGNPYSLTFGEANDPEKGYQILFSDGSLEFIPTGLRQHRVLELDSWMAQNPGSFQHSNTDLIWVKVKGPSDELAKITKKIVAKNCGIKQDFRLDLIPTDEAADVKQSESLSQGDLLDATIDALRSTGSRKDKLKTMWKDLIS